MFKEKGHAAAMKELDQLHKRMCFTPVDINDLTTSEKKKAMEAMMLLTEKKDKTVKGRMVYNGKPFTILIKTWMLLIHAIMCWPDVSDTSLWPMAVDYALHHQNEMP